MNDPGLSDPALETDLLAAVENLQEEMVDLAMNLVRFPSLNGNEAGAQAFLADGFERMGLDTESFEVRDEDVKSLPGYSPAVGHWKRHANVVGTHRPRTATGRSLILNGHIDVVPVGAEELWSRLGNPSSLYGHPWPKWDPAALAVDSVPIAVQVMGKVRGSFHAAPDATKLVVTAERGRTDYGICSTEFLEYAFRTDSYRLEVEFHDDGSWSYISDTMLMVRGRTELF